MEPEEALHWHILRRKKDGVEDWIDKSVDKIGAVPTLNDVLLPAMKEVGDKFGAGELILPFVLQSAEVMKRAVAQLENYLERTADYTKGTVVIATVFGDVHDIGKSLVNTILTNNGYTVVDLGKQVPVSTIIDAAKEHNATAIGLSALLVSTSKQMPLCVQELHSQKLEFPVLIGGAAINRDFGLRALYPGGRESDDVYEPGVFYCKDAFEGLAKMDQIVEPDADDRETVLERFVFPRQPEHDRLCLADFYRPRESGELDVVAFQAVTAGDEVTELMKQLEAEGEFAEQLFVHGLGVQTAEGMAEWLHGRIRADLGIPASQGRRWSWGYPACPEQSEHEKLFRLIEAPRIALRLSGGFALEPEQSTVAIVSHHPEAVYFGMKSGRLPKTDKQARDEVIKGSEKDPT